MRIFLIAIGCALASGVPATAAEEADQRLLREFRRKLAELKELEGKFKGSILGGSLMELGQVGFILSRAGVFSRRRLHDDDRAFVNAAVRGQPRDELERNLPAIITYVKLSTVAGPMAAHARARWTWVGTRGSLATLVKVERDIAFFRGRQYTRVKGDLTTAPRVLTRSNLGALGDASTYRELRQAFIQGESFQNMLRDFIGYAYFTGSLAILSAAAVFLQRKAAAAYRVPSLIREF